MNNHDSLSRRDCLRALAMPLAAYGLGAPISAALAAAPNAAPNVATTSALAQKRLILFTLNGGNDGLNTVVPHRDPLYRALRPTVSVAANELLGLNDELALHPRLPGLMAMLQAGEVALVQDVGYPEPSLSHFESADIWSSGETRREARHEGWYGKLVMHNREHFNAAGFDAAAIAFDKSNGFANGRGVPVLIAGPNLFDERRATQTAPRAEVGPGAPEALARLAEMVNEGHAVDERVARRLQGVPRLQWKPYEDPMAVQTKLAHWFMARGVSAPLIRVTQDGYDTHAGQLPRHAVLLGQLDAALVDLRTRLKADGLWDDTVVMVHSEFGRRAKQNGYDGTDHGSAGPVFLIGGKVRGGVYGQRAALDRLDGDGNVHFTTDFRRVFSTLVGGLWGLQANPIAAAGFAPLEIGLG